MPIKLTFKTFETLIMLACLEDDRVLAHLQSR
jgi:hypothetical protein